MENNKRNIIPYLLCSPPLLIVILFIVVPIINSIIRSFQHSETGYFTLENYSMFFTNSLQFKNIIYTLYIVVVTVILVTLISYLLAMLLRFSKSIFSRAIGPLILFPRFIPGMVAVYAVIQIISDFGVIRRLSLLFGNDFSLGWMYNASGIIIMNLWFNIPLATLIIFSSLIGLSDSIFESARDVGANKWQIFIKLVLPLTYKDALVAITLIYMSNVGSFTTPFLMGGNSPKMLGVALYDQFNAYMNFEGAAALSVIMFMLCVIPALIYIYSNLKETKWEKN